MDKKTLRQQSAEALASELQDAKSLLQSLQFKLASQQVKNVREIRQLKKQIARVHTIVRLNKAAQ